MGHRVGMTPRQHVTSRSRSFGRVTRVPKGPVLGRAGHALDRYMAEFAHIRPPKHADTP